MDGIEGSVCGYWAALPKETGWKAATKSRFAPKRSPPRSKSFIHKSSSASSPNVPFEANVWLGDGHSVVPVGTDCGVGTGLLDVCLLCVTERLPWTSSGSEEELGDSPFSVFSI